MSRLFLSVLGLGPWIEDKKKNEYAKCVYRSANGETLLPTRYIQEASIRLFCKGWDSSKGDRVRILCTEESFKHQWQGEEHLLECLTELKSKADYANLDFSESAIKMPEGKSKDEIWQIFNALFDCVNEGDEIWLDVTHGYRSIPMLVITAVPYLRLLKKAEIRSITYGAYEAKDKDNNIVPIFDLTDFVGLMDWTNAASNFVRFARFDDCEQLMNAVNQDILKETKGKDKEANTCRGLAKQIDRFTNGVLQNRLESSVINGIPQAVFDDIDNLSELELRIPPFRPLLNKISDKLSPFKQNCHGNVFAAVRWCLEHRYLQNGYSILLEGCVLIIKENLKRDGHKDVADEDWNAKSPNSPIGVYKRWKKERDSHDQKELDEKQKELRKSMFKDKFDYAQALFTLSQVRNAFMHCGTGRDKLPDRDGVLEEQLRDCCDKLEKWYKELNLEEE